MGSSLSSSIAVQKGMPSAPLWKWNLSSDICIYSSKLGVAVQPICTGVARVYHGCRAARLPGGKGEGFAG